MSNEKWVQTIIWAVIFLNLVVICRVFIIPRADFISAHLKESREALRESAGPPDMPNQYVRTYQMMNQVRTIVGEGAIVLFPPDDWEFGSPRSAVIQTLYPRRVYFSGDQRFDEKLSQALKHNEAYVVFNGKWGQKLCKARKVQGLGEIGFGICQISKSKN